MPSTSPGARRTACLSLAAPPGVGAAALEGAVRTCSWPERALRWHDAKAPGRGSGFSAGDLFPESSLYDEAAAGSTPWLRAVPGQPPEAVSAGKRGLSPRVALVVCASAESHEAEAAHAFAAQLVQQLLAQLGAGAETLLAAARCELVSDAKRIPIMPVDHGLEAVCVPAHELTSSRGCDHLAREGLFLVPGAICARDAAALRELVAARVADMEEAMQQQGERLGGDGKYSFAEVVHRGSERWDMSLHREGEAVGSARAAADPRLAVLKRVAAEGPWVPTVRTVLDEHKWEAGAVVSRPGARGQGWHADGVHSKYDYGGESGPPPALCVFIPLVDLLAPARAADGAVEAHGRGCTAFWPGSHRMRQCAHLGAIAAERLDVGVLAAPLTAGSAVVYDLRVVHCGTPNDAFELAGAERDRPILQITYHRTGTRKGNFYGYDELFRM